jgi:hypothetical protein
MPAYLYDRLVTEDEYRQRIRRHRPSSLLPLIAAAAARYSTPERPQAWLESPSAILPGQVVVGGASLFNNVPPRQQPCCCHAVALSRVTGFPGL